MQYSGPASGGYTYTGNQFTTQGSGAGGTLYTSGGGGQPYTTTM